MADDRLHIEQKAFLERHRDAHWLVCDTGTGECTTAIYESPMKKANDAMQAFWREVRLAMDAEGEDEFGPS